MIKIDFEYETAHGKFRDALHLPNDHTFTEEEIEQMKQQRLDNWVAVVTAPPVEQPPAPEEGPITIADETYEKLTGVPPAGAKLVEINGVWYYKV